MIRNADNHSLFTDLYRKILEDDNLKIEFQDEINSFFQQRLIDVRAELRNYGWTLKHKVSVLKKSFPNKIIIADSKPITIGLKGNIVGIIWFIEDVQINDNLTKKAGELAEEINSVALMTTKKNKIGEEYV